MKSQHFPGSQCITHQVEVKATPTYVPNEKINTDLIEHFKKENNIFVYKIEITNHRPHWIKLLDRYWKIIDSEGQEKIINGEGVVGEQPKLFTDETFVYSSFCPLESEWGTMEGSYGMIDHEDNLFRVDIGRFYLVKDDNYQTNYVKGKNSESK